MAEMTLTDLTSVYRWLDEKPEVEAVTEQLRKARELRQAMDAASGTLAAYVMASLGLEEGDEPDEIREIGAF